MSAPDGAAWLRLGAASRELRRALRPLEWVVLEDVALDAAPDGAGRLVAATSARAVAEHLGITPGAASKALARLRTEGLVRLSRRPGEGGRFGLSAYELTAVPGLAVIAGGTVPAPVVEEPRPATPRAAPPRAAERHTVPPSRRAAKAATDVGQLDLLSLDLDLPAPPR